MSAREAFSTQVDADILRAVRATVEGLQRILGPREVTLAAFTTAALAEAVEQAESRYNEGRPFLGGDRPLLGGARVSAHSGGSRD